MKKLMLYTLAILFPWLALLLSDNPGGALIALVMQATLIGWPFAASMAIKNVRSFYEFDKLADSDETDAE